MRLFIAVIAAVFALALPARADTAADMAALRAAQAYLDGITTMKARFVQTAYDGKRATGEFLLKRPGRMRFQYDAPITDFIVADGSQIYYWDDQMKQRSSAPISKSLADFFLRRNLTFSGDIRVAEVKRRKGDIRIKLVQAQDPLSGSMELILGEKPMQLKKWRVIDAQGLATDVELSDAVTGVKISNDAFRWFDPSRQHPQYN
jgi:outer membrane lipoprotein-sorting protein